MIIVPYGCNYCLGATRHSPFQPETVIYLLVRVYRKFLFCRLFGKLFLFYIQDRDIWRIRETNPAELSR